MAQLDRSRQQLDLAVKAFERINRSTAESWSDDARRRFDRQIAEPLLATARQYASTLSQLDEEVQRALRLLER